MLKVRTLTNPYFPRLCEEEERVNGWLIVFYIWLIGFALIAFIGWTCFTIDTIKRIRKFNKAQGEVYTVEGWRATCEEDIWADMLSNYVTVVVLAIFWPVGLIRAIIVAVKALIKI